MARKRNPRTLSLQCTTLRPDSPIPRCSRVGKYGGEVDVAHRAPRSSREPKWSFCQNFWDHFGIPFGAFRHHFSDVGMGLKPTSLRGPFLNLSSPGSDSPKCSGACKYHGELDVAVLAPGTLSGRSQSRNRVHNGTLGELIWASEEGRNLGVIKEGLGPHP